MSSLAEMKVAHQISPCGSHSLAICSRNHECSSAPDEDKNHGKFVEEEEEEEKDVCHRTKKNWVNADILLRSEELNFRSGSNGTSSLLSEDQTCRIKEETKDGDDEILDYRNDLYSPLTRDHEIGNCRLPNTRISQEPDRANAVCDRFGSLLCVPSLLGMNQLKFGTKRCFQEADDTDLMENDSTLLSVKSETDALSRDDIKEEVTVKEENATDDEEDQQAEPMPCFIWNNFYVETPVEVKQEPEEFETPEESLQQLSGRWNNSALCEDDDEMKFHTGDHDTSRSASGKVRQRFRPQRLGVVYAEDSEAEDSNTGMRSSGTKSHDDDERLERHSKKEHICTVCNRVFQKPSHLIYHLRTHTGEKPYECNYCGKAFHLPKLLRVHVRRHTGELLYKCRICGKAYPQENDLNRHSLLHSGDRRYKCSICDKAYSRSNHLKRHIMIHTGEKPFRCDMCGMSYRKSESIKNHMLIHSGAEKPHKCNSCEKSYFEKSNLIEHKRTHNGERPLMCEICGARFARQSHFLRHCRMHTGEKPYRCETCGRGFTRSHRLIAHRNKHSSREADFHCYVCREKFSSSDLVQEHINLEHGGIVQLACEVCGMEFTTAYELTCHRRLHSNGKVFQCQMCDKTFVTKYGLVLHCRTHSGERPYVCEVCGASFTRSNSLQRHNMTHDGDKPHKCTECEKSFTRPSLLKNHIQKAHKTITAVKKNDNDD